MTIVETARPKPDTLDCETQGIMLLSETADQSQRDKSLRMRSPSGGRSLPLYTSRLLDSASLEAGALSAGTLHLLWGNDSHGITLFMSIFGQRQDWLAIGGAER